MVFIKTKSPINKLILKSRPIRVVHIITKLELGGAQLNTLYTVEHLEKKPFDPYLLSGDGGLLNDRVKNKDSFRIIKDLIRQIRPSRDLKAFFQICKELKRIHPHVVHTHSSKAGIIGRISAFSLGIPVIVHSVHGFSFSHFHPLWKRIIFKGAEKITARFTDHFIFVSREDADTAQQLGLVKSNHSLIRSGFPLKDFLKSSGRGQAIRKKYNITKNDFVCGIIAPFKPQKGFNYLIQAASRVLKKTRNIVFFVAGDGELRPAIEKELKKRDIYQYFRLPGFIRDIPSILDIFDCGLSTALWEGLPQSIVQLRLKKIPVIASNIPGHREIIHDNQNGFLVNIGDHEGFARKIILLMSNPKKRESLGSYPDDFSDWNADHMVQKQQELYVELLKVKSKERTNG